jgi:hypothetical protein
LGRSNFFNACLHPQNFKEGVEKVVTLPEDIPDAVGIVLAFLYKGRLNLPMEVVGMFYPGGLDSQAVTKLIDLYLIADRLCIEKMANDIVTVLYKAGASFEVTRSHFEKFEGVDGEALPLIDLLVAKRARDFADGLRRGPKEVAYDFEKKMRGLKDQTEEYDEEYAWNRRGYIYYLGNPCRWHKHSITAECA